MTTLVEHFTTQWKRSLRQFESAEKAFREITDAYHERYSDQVTAERLAAEDVDRRVAVADAAYYRDRALMYGVSVLVEIARGEG